jgi:hypothetical protein
MKRTIGDMHRAIVAVEELGGTATPEEIATKLRWCRDIKEGESLADVVAFIDSRGNVFARGVLDVNRAETALIAACEHGYFEEAK